MDNIDELRQRRLAIRLWLQGRPTHALLARVQRSRAWLSKWVHRFQQGGGRGLRSHSRKPRHRPGAYSPRIIRLIIQTRRQLSRQRVGLIGARAIRRALSQTGLGAHTPSIATIKRVLHTHGLSAPPPTIRSAYCPSPATTLHGTVYAIDWTGRYLEGGTKVYAFHTLNVRTRACAQTIAGDKNLATVQAHMRETLQTLGVPQYVQLDNDAVFNGGYKAPRIFGQFVRFCLYLSIELIFLPVAEPERNGAVEQLNRLWSYAFFNKHHFASLHRVQRASTEFVDWYLHDYAPPALGERTPQQAQRAEPGHYLKPRQLAHLPATLPITAGRIHFIRRVDTDGAITLFNETWPINRRLVGRYVWATLTTHARRLVIWYQSAPDAVWRVLKTFSYDIPETVAHRDPRFTCR